MLVRFSEYNTGNTKVFNHLQRILSSIFPLLQETPCWIEIQLHRALQLADELMHSIPIDHVRGAPRSVGGVGQSSVTVRSNHMSGEQ